VTPSARTVWRRGHAVPWQDVWAVGRSLVDNGRGRIKRNLSIREQRELRRLMRRARAHPVGLAANDRQRFALLVKKAATGEPRSSWETVLRTLPTLLPARQLAAIWHRARS
jgi:hypothetical protein